MADPNVETIAAYVRPSELTVDALDPVRVARRRMEAGNLRTLPVVRDERYVGVIDWQTVRRLSGRELDEMVARHAQTDVPKLSESTTIANAMAAFREVDVTTHGLLPVVDKEGNLTGQIEREEFQGLMEDSSGAITVPDDPIAHLLTGPDMPNVGAKVVGSRGEKLGKFVGYIEDRGRPRWIEVQHGPFWKRRLRKAPLVAIDRQSPREIVLHIDRATWATFQDHRKGQG